MPAPQPVIVRYGDAGVLGSAASQLGSLQRQQREEAEADAAYQRDAQMLLQQFNQRANRNMAAQDQAARRELEMLKAQQQNRARRQPTAGPNRRRSALADQVQQQRDQREPQVLIQEGRSPIVTGGDPHRYREYTGAIQNEPSGSGYATNEAGERFQVGADGITGTRGGGQIPQSEIGQRGGFVQSSQPQQMDLMTDAKLAYAESIGAGRLPARHREALKQLVTNPEVDLSQFRLAANKALKTNQESTADGEVRLSPAQQAQMQVHALGNEAKRLQSQAEELAMEFSPEELNMTVDEFEKHTLDQVDVQSWWNPADWNDTPTFTSDAEADARVEQFKRLKTLKGDLNTVRERRNQMIGLDDGGSDDGSDDPGNEGKTYVDPNGAAVPWSRIQETARNRGLTTQEVIQKLGFRPAGA